MKGLEPETLPEGVGRIPLDTFVGEAWVPDGQRNIWLERYKENRAKIKPFPKTYLGAGKACILVGASPAIKKNYQRLRALGKDFLIVACNGAAKFLTEHGIRPDYIFCVEAGEHIVKDFDFDTEGLTLIAGPYIPSKVYETFKGDVFTYLVGGGETVDGLIREDFGKSAVEIGGGNVVSTGLLWAYKFLMSRYFIFTGMSLCYYDKYYFDDRSTKFVGQDLEGLRGNYMALDIYGDQVSTTPALTMYKVWLETYLRYAHDAVFVNATEDGILGVYPEVVDFKEEEIYYKTRYLPWITIAPLDVAVRGFIDWKKERKTKCQ
jgi:hypothetical protein